MSVETGSINQNIQPYFHEMGEQSRVNQQQQNVDTSTRSVASDKPLTQTQLESLIHYEYELLVESNNQ